MVGGSVENCLGVMVVVGGDGAVVVVVVVTVVISSPFGWVVALRRLFVLFAPWNIPGSLRKP